MALWPDALRHPLGFERPLLTAADFDGARLRVPTSDTSFRLVRALGAEPVAADLAAGVPPAWTVSKRRSTCGDLPTLGTFTANITFYPKVNALVANAELLDSLSDDQRDVLRRAATDTTAYAVDTNPTEHDLAEQYCADGGSVALADAADLAELAELAAPVVAELEAGRHDEADHRRDPRAEEHGDDGPGDRRGGVWTGRRGGVGPDRQRVGRRRTPRGGVGAS